MSQQTHDTAQALDVWLAGWSEARSAMQELIAAHSKRNPSLYFEPALAELELKDINEAVQRAAALARLLRSDELMSSAELQGTGNC